MSSKGSIIMTRFPYESVWGGEESHTIALAESLRDVGYTVVFLGSCSVLAEKFYELGFRVKKVWGGKMIVTGFELMKSFLLFPFIWWSMRKALQKLSDENIVACYMLSLNEKLFMTNWFLKKDIPVTWVEHQEFRGWMTKSPWRYLYSYWAKRVMIIPVSPKNKKLLRKSLKVPEKNLKEIVNGVNVVDIQKIQEKRRKGLVVVANRMIAKKGILEFLKAIKILKNENIEFSNVVILGKGPQKSFLERFIEKNFDAVSVEIKDFLKKEKYYQLLSQADLFVSSAQDENETFSLSSAEALAAGAKLVVTKCSGIAHFLEDKKEAYICEPNPKDMAEKIVEALQSKEVIRDIAKKAAREKFNQRNMLQKYHQLILRKS